MGNQKLRKIKEVNGWKVNHPHSASNNVYAIFTLIFSLFPLCLLFIPLYSDVPVDFRSGLNGLDIFRYTIDKLTELFSQLFKGSPSVVATNPYIDMMSQGLFDPSENPVMSQAIMYTFVAMGVILALIMVLSVVLIILSIVHLAKGYLKSSAAVKRIAITDFIFTLLIFVGFIFIFFTVRALTTPPADLFVWLTAIPLGVSLFFAIFFAGFHGSHFRDSILEKDLKLQDEEITVEHVSKVHEINKVKYTESTTLPPNLESIGGHAFSENQNLIVANIPLDITKLGAGAFANCLNLQVVSIPNSVKEIGFNCFFNCVELERINYAGTKAEWRKIRRGSNWLAKAKTTEVVCLDGTVIVNPYH